MSRVCWSNTSDTPMAASSQRPLPWHSFMQHRFRQLHPDNNMHSSCPGSEKMSLWTSLNVWGEAIGLQLQKQTCIIPPLAAGLKILRDVKSDEKTRSPLLLNIAPVVSNADEKQSPYPYTLVGYTALIIRHGSILSITGSEAVTHGMGKCIDGY